MRTFIAMDDVERGADALAQAERYGYTAGNRDWALLGEGYLTRAAKLAESEELEPLTRAAEAYTKAIDHLSKATGCGNAAQRLREAQRRLKEVQERIETAVACPMPARTGGMSVTYTTAAERDRQRRGTRPDAPGPSRC